MKLWQKDYPLDKEIEKFTVGNDPIIDLLLVKYDCLASIAHAKMLSEMGILNNEEFVGLESELRNIIRLVHRGEFKISIEDEDCHTAIENHLKKKLGKTAGKIHTARSRNDQVLTAIRLYSRDKLKQVESSLLGLVKTLGRAGKKYQEVKMPGYTHSRKAMPYSVGRYFGAFKEALEDDRLLLELAYKINDQNPLGSGAGYGISLKTDRRLTTKLLDFRRTQKNELYCQNSRGKFESIILFALGQILLDLERLANDFILFSMTEFGYFDLPDEFCTGSSIMPHKKNPDVLELVRAKSSVVISYCFRVIDLVRGLHSGYSRDLQLTKEPLMNGFQITLDTIEIMNLITARLKVNKKNCRKACTEEIFSAERAYDLVKKGMDFRSAYRKIYEELDNH
jgi:argininosuccinate lyase